MEVRIKDNSVEIEGYVNAVERNSKTLRDRLGSFIERICKGAFGKALKRNDDVHILLNHDWDRDLGSTKKGNLELKEDNIGLKAKATITDPDVVKKARNGDLVGWSFGFIDRDVERTINSSGIDNRVVHDLDLYEVSILDKTKVPAYDGTLIEARDDGSNEIHIRNEITDPDVKEPAKENNIEELSSMIADKIFNKLRDEKKSPKEANESAGEKPQEEEPKVEDKPKEVEPKQQEVVKNIDYSKYENMIKQMKEE